MKTVDYGDLCFTFHVALHFKKMHSHLPRVYPCERETTSRRLQMSQCEKGHSTPGKKQTLKWPIHSHKLKQQTVHRSGFKPCEGYWTVFPSIEANHAPPCGWELIRVQVPSAAPAKPPESNSHDWEVRKLHFKNTPLPSWSLYGFKFRAFGIKNR